MSCAWCGDDIGPGRNNPREPEPCGKKECQAEVRAFYREMDESARYEAEQDNYERYR